MINPRGKKMDHSRVTDRILLLLAITLFVWILVHKSCNEPNGNSDKSDTVYVQGTPDTVIIHDTTFKEVIKPVPYATYKYIRDTFHLSGDPEQLADLTCDTIRVYIDSIEDGTCKVIVKDSVRGELLGWSAELYSKSMTITRVDTLKITSYPNKWRIGIGAGVSQGLLLYGSATRGRNQFIGGYDFNSKAPFIGLGLMITK